MDQIWTNSLPGELSEYTWRPIKPDDLSGIREMLAEASPVDRTEGPPTEARLNALLGMLGDQVEKNTRLVLTPDGSPAAALMFFVAPGSDENLAMFEGNVAVNQRGRGIGSVLLRWAESRAHELFGSVNASQPGSIRTSCTRHQADRVQLYESHGYQAVRYSYKMRRMLNEPVEEVSLPAGLSWMQWVPALDPQLVEAFNEAFRDNWGVPTLNEEAWQTFFTGVPQFRGDLSYLALDRDKIAGFCINWVEERADGKEGWVEAIGVHPSWRGRGVASALMSRSLAMFRAEGLERAGLDVDTQNPTGALRLYRKHGFEVAKETIHFMKTLS
jgi:mycothiol synthase